MIVITNASGQWVGACSPNSRVSAPIIASHSGARALCDGVGVAGGLTGKPAQTVADACHKAGVPVRLPRRAA